MSEHGSGGKAGIFLTCLIILLIEVLLSTTIPANAQAIQTASQFNIQPPAPPSQSSCTAWYDIFCNAGNTIGVIGYIGAEISYYIQIIGAAINLIGVYIWSFLTFAFAYNLYITVSNVFILIGVIWGALSI